MTAPARNSTSERALNLAKSFVDAGFDVRGVKVDGRCITVLLNDDAPMIANDVDVDAELKALERSIVGE